MTDFSVDFLGCKISQTDAETIRDALATAGHTEGDLGRVRVVNTCCITGEAEKKSRKKVRRLLATGDDAKVFVTGCGATLRPEVYSEFSERVTVLPGGAALAAGAIVQAADELAGLGCKGPPPGPSRSGHTRAFVKIQDGCSFGCSYCVVPVVRGDSRSRPLDAVLADVARRVSRGQHEIVLTGVNIGLYRDEESRAGLASLLREVAAADDVWRVRISSIEVNHVDRRLVAAMAELPNVCPHLHVPLQSGDDSVLRAMGRHYRAATYARAIDRARHAMPDLNLTTDIIVGFPAEDEHAATQTRRFAHDMGFTKVHAFPFSPRPGTPVGPETDPVPKAVKAERSLALRGQADAFALARWRGKVGSSDEVLVERGGSRAGMTLTSDPAAAAAVGDAAAPRQMGGYTRDYCPIRLVGDAKEGDLVEVRITDASPTGLVGAPRRDPALHR